MVLVFWSSWWLWDQDCEWENVCSNLSQGFPGPLALAGAGDRSQYRMENGPGDTEQVRDKLVKNPNIPPYNCVCFSSDFGYNIDDYNDQKNQQLHTILIIIVSVFSACCIILMVYMLMFPASSSSLPPPGGGPGQGQDSAEQAQQKTLVPPLLKRNSQILEDKV